ncbi:isoprenyl transferase [Micrococcoides hystricis]|uniref:Isoprenyl transferase n=1 Tax=Micrococcoides hystricis TaxID=1572761 RepID=A0ABV6PA69_9MICC
MIAKALYPLYERRLLRSLDQDQFPGHIGVVVDGNRRWAKATGETTAFGHQAGAAKIIEFLGWCHELGIHTVTLYMLSTDNLKRPAQELQQLINIISDTVAKIGAGLPDGTQVQLQCVGQLQLLPAQLRERLTEISDQTASNEGIHVNVAIGYGGRQEIVDAVRDLLLAEEAAGRACKDIAEDLSAAKISQYLYTRGQPDPDLVIRTSGEQRLSGFLLWQAAYSELYFCEALWPDFRKTDFLRALRDYTKRQRRFGI